MSNRFFNRLFSAADGTFALAASVLNEYASIEAGFLAVQNELDTLRPSWLPTNLGAAFTILRTNGAGTAVEFVSPGRLPIVSVTVSRDLALTDMGKLLVCTNATAITLTLQPFATIAIPTESAFVVSQNGAGKVTIAPGAGVTLRAADNLLSTRAQYSQITGCVIATNEALIGGDRTA